MYSSLVFIFTILAFLMLLPLQGARLIALIPRVLPWARSFCPFRACGGKVSKVPLHRPCGTSRVTHQLPPYPDVLCELVYQYCRRQSPILMTGDTCDTCFLKLSLTRAGRKNFPERFPARLRERDFKKSLSLVSSCHPEVSLIPAS